MIFGREKRKPAKPPRDAGATPASALTSDSLLDLGADLLRSFGEHAFDVLEQSAADTRTAFDQWARHLLVGAPAPGEENGDGGAPVTRNLARLRRAFREQRRKESEFVASTLANYREATWTFLGGLRRSLAADRMGDGQIHSRMQELEAAVIDGDAERIMREAQDTVHVLSRVLAEREQRSAEQLAELAGRLETLREELDAARNEAATDALTGLYNRGAFDDQIEREIDLALLFQTRRALLMIDIDHFKRVNDERGHRGGDEVLRRIADVLVRSFMRRDDYLARYGGEEFAVVLREVDLAMARELADRALHAVRRLEIAVDGGPPVAVTISIGIAELVPGEPLASWIDRADRALYRAKNGGRDRVEVAS